MRLKQTAAAAALLLAAATPAFALTINLDSDFGPVTLNLAESGPDVTGTYPDYKGKILAKTNADASMIEGYWIQPKSDEKCSTQQGGSYYWGRIAFPKPQGGNIKGKWSYCNAAPTETWNAKMK